MGERPMQKESWGRSSASLGVTAAVRKLLWASFMCSIVLVLQNLAQPATADPVLASSVGFCKPVRLEATQEEKDRSVQCCLPAPRRTPKSTSLALKRLGVTDWNTDITVTVVPRFRPHGYGWNIKALTFDCLRQEFT
ncbi:hypothetical protein AXG93_2175s1720 [Marchantia polymorpha subsp. ruderalis]|uniref:Uncharacterized protein n=1 Tax=Marchantia polymorpha subsp. ruderalis TaxID=1480154 RepID=A0A176W6A4_MARPO|nr:hypothetical protein AXG93_2175s1720 [Marchantia polymorpha subsp. ruderalis]